MSNVIFTVIGPDHAGQRIDNYLIGRLKSVPKARLYRAIRNGEVRVNKGRVKPSYHLQSQDEVRIPPLLTPTATAATVPTLPASFESAIVFEDDGLLVVDKPAGLPVHGGSGIAGGLIERLRITRPESRFLELIHRLDKDTSGCLLIAKKRSVLLQWHRLLAERQVQKQYLALVHGRWQGGARTIDLPLLKQHLPSGERKVVVSATGKAAKTRVRPLRIFRDTALLEVYPVTGRTHQIRVHLAQVGHPIVGDKKYACQLAAVSKSVKRLFLHASGVSVRPSASTLTLGLCVPPPAAWSAFLTDWV